MVRKVAEKTLDGQLQEDLEKYRQRALELGAADARIISADTVVVDERVRAKCIYPKCPGYGTSVHCPPHAIDVDLTRKIVNNFQQAIFIKLETPSETMAGESDRRKKLGLPWRKNLFEIIAKIESEAFYDGHYLALGFTCGSCKSVFCPGIECSALLLGEPCRHPLKARSSMESVGMDAFAMATRVGWDIYPIGEVLSESDVPHGLLLGLVLVA